MRQVRLVMCTLVVAALLGFAPSGSAQTLTYVTIDPVGLGNVWAAGIAGSAAASCDYQGQQEGDFQCDDNGAGAPPGSSAGIQVVGHYSLTASSPSQSYLWNGTMSTPLAVPGALETSASGINGTGHVAGTYADATGVHGFLMVGTAAAKLDAPGGLVTFGMGISATDQVVGFFVDKTTFRPRGFLYSGGVYTAIDYPGMWGTYATGINSLGQIVGYACTITNVCLAWLRTGTSLAQVPVAGALDAKANGINASGEIVGQFSDATGGHGFRLAGGRLTVVNIPGASYTAINGVNERGEISGEYRGSLIPRQLGFKMP